MFRSALASRHRRRCSLIAVIITAGTVILNLPWARQRVPGASLLFALELKLIDWRFQERGRRPPPADVVIAAVDEDAIRQEGRWPWPRCKMGQVIHSLRAVGARAIVLDIFYAERDASPGGAESDQALARATQRAGNVFHAWFGATDRSGAASVPQGSLQALTERAWSMQLASRPGQGILSYASVTPPLPELTRAARGVGYADLQDSGDGVFRFYDLAARYGGVVYPSLALSVVASDLGVPPERVSLTPGRTVRLGDQMELPLAAGGRALLDFYGPDGTISRLSVADILARRVSPHEIAGKIVLVGATAKGAYELRPSPFGAVFYGVELQATAIGNLLSGEGLRVSSLGTDLLITIGFGLIVGLGLPLWRPAVGSVLSLALFLGYNTLGAVLFSRTSYVMPMAAPNVALVACVLAISVYRLSTEERRRSRITTMFGLFVPPEVVQQLAAEEAPTTRLEADRREVTILFSDVWDFTSYTERRQAEDVVALLNRYFSLMHEVVWQFGGTLDKYMGDGLMAFFGAPTHQEDHAERAVLAALEMQRQTRLHQKEWAAFGLTNLRVGIGLHTGQALVGYAGSKGRMQYTCLGNAVNLASRLEELNREFNTKILISDALYERVKGVVEAKPIGRARIRGLSSEVLVYSVMGAAVESGTDRDALPGGTRDDAEEANPRPAGDAPARLHDS